ncbi:745d5c98-447c-4536-9e7d-462d28236f0b [Thermothielavioides terrestris]|nr:745d5c98-447c-4536-9e7d-462d28236f0b [Thermothielavioides terrestris]
MYYRVQNLEDFPEALTPARAMLQSLLAQELLMARDKASPFNVLDIEEFDPARLRKPMEAKYAHVRHEFESYVQRRQAGGGPELFKTFEEACQFLKSSAPWNYVDGAWLARFHQITTRFALRDIFSEELGDGDLEKNHVVLYGGLLRSIGVNLPDGDSADFIDPRDGMEDRRPSAGTGATSPMTKRRVCLAYSGGLDTSCILK